jgi:hypothetical protein
MKTYMNNILDLKKRVMSRIYIIYAKNIFMEYPDYFMLLLFMVVFFTLNSASHILANMPKDNLANVFNFSVVALEKTDWIIQALIVGFLIRVVFVASKLTYKNRIVFSKAISSWLPLSIRLR